MQEDLERRIDDDTPALTIYAQMGAIMDHDTRDRLGELGGLPTLVLHGHEDALVPVERARELAELVPGSRLVLLPSCGHVLATDAEEDTAFAILEQLDRCSLHL